MTNHSKILYDPPPRVIEIKFKKNKWDLIKLKHFCIAKETINKAKRHPSEWEKIHFLKIWLWWGFWLRTHKTHTEEHQPWLHSSEGICDCKKQKPIQHYAKPKENLFEADRVSLSDPKGKKYSQRVSVNEGQDPRLRAAQLLNSCLHSPTLMVS